MNTTHTPGPWFWSQGVDDWELVGAGANRVLFCWNDKTKWKSWLVVGENIKEADARLIAAIDAAPTVGWLRPYGRGLSTSEPSGERMPQYELIARPAKD